LDSVVVTNDLSKSYGNHEALRKVNLEVRKGEVFGYLGPNGSGKSTTIRTLLDFLRPTEGSASIFGLDSREESRAIRARVGYLPGDMVLYERLTGREVIAYSAALRGGVDWADVERLQDRLDAELSRPIKTLSRGNRQKIGLIQAFMHRPELIIMDEPTSGLDPLLQQEFHLMVEEVRADGRTVFISSHDLSEVERLCDRVGIIRRGQLVTVEDVAVLRERALHRIEFQFATAVSAADFDDVQGVRDIEVEGQLLRCTVEGSPDSIVKAAARFEVTKVITQEPHLEEVFLSYYGDGDTDAE
jgi:ABC-2 type transport system ATP-binding protein